jgi:hypothetical protein
MDLVTCALVLLALLTPPPERHIIYLHGRIVQAQQSVRPRHAEFGYYELEKIRETFRTRGFVVHSVVRPKESSVDDGANQVVRQVKQLLASGVTADRITVVGASMGASIAFQASSRLANPELRFAVLGACLEANLKAMKSEGTRPVGKFLAVREASDEMSTPCDAPSTGREIVVNTGLGHGFIYRPLVEWVEPVLEFAGGD